MSIPIDNAELMSLLESSDVHTSTQVKDLIQEQLNTGTRLHINLQTYFSLRYVKVFLYSTKEVVFDQFLLFVCFVVIWIWDKCLQCFDAVGWAAGRASGL